MIGFHRQDQDLNSERSGTHEFECDYLGRIESAWGVRDSQYLKTIQIYS